MNIKNTKALTRTAILAAMSIVLTRFFSFYLTPNMRIGFGTLPLILAGILYGPVLGGLAGLVADLLGLLINSGGFTPHLGFTLSSFLTGFIPGLIQFYLLRNRQNKSVKLTIILSVAIVYGFIHLVLNSIWLVNLYQNPFIIILLSRMPKIIIESVLAVIILNLVFDKVISRIKII